MSEDPQPAGVGNTAPDVTLRDEDGGEARLSAYWQHQAAVLVFVRHFG